MKFRGAVPAVHVEGIVDEAKRSVGADILRDFEARIRSGAVRRVRRGDDVSDEAIVTWCEREMGVRLHSTPVVMDILLEAVRAFREKRMLRMVVLGPRGGGKTMLTAVIEVIAYRFFGFDWNNVGGSQRQAMLCYGYIRNALAASADLSRFTAKSQLSETRSHAGGVISVCSASHTSVRGPHPVGPSGGGGITLDEAAIIPDDIVDAAKGQLTSARPSALIQLSTMGERQAGRFWELIQRPAEMGYQLKQFNIFEVAARCKYDCATTCPVKDFAHDQHEGDDPTRPLIHKAYCGGRAHEVDGWVSVDEIAQQWRESDRHTFERELMGVAGGMVGAIYDARLIDELSDETLSLGTTREQHLKRFAAVEKAIGVDWGFAGQTAFCYALRLRDTAVVYRWDFASNTRYSVLREEIARRMLEENIGTALCDAANPSDNEELEVLLAREFERAKRPAPVVRPVGFGEWKAYGIGEVRRRIEKKLIRFPKVFGGAEVTNWKPAIGYLKGYKADDHGKPIKKDDHGPDALLCAMIGWSHAWSGGSRIY